MTQNEMNDREMLELAAKAAGMPKGAVMGGGDYLYEIRGKAIYWNPLTDDGDALRLAVTLGIGVQSYSGLGYSHAGIETVKKSIVVKELNDDGPYAATRRAIVRAVAEIERSKNG
jgi:hypothetical protein